MIGTWNITARKSHLIHLYRCSKTKMWVYGHFHIMIATAAVIVVIIIIAVPEITHRMTPTIRTRYAMMRRHVTVVIHITPVTGVLMIVPAMRLGVSMDVWSDHPAKRRILRILIRTTLPRVVPLIRPVEIVHYHPLYAIGVVMIICVTRLVPCTDASTGSIVMTISIVNAPNRNPLLLAATVKVSNRMVIQMYQSIIMKLVYYHSFLYYH